jgi:hypothetical protein
MPVPDYFWHSGLLWQLDFNAPARCWVITAPGHHVVWSATERPIWPHALFASAPVEQAKGHIDQAGCGARACGCKVLI